MTPAPLTIPRSYQVEVELNEAIMAAVKAVANLSPIVISGNRGHAADAECIAADIMDVAEIADDLIGALVAYAAWHFDGIKEGDFRSLCRDACQDNVVATLQQIADRLRDDDDEGHRHDFQRSVRA